MSNTFKLTSVLSIALFAACAVQSETSSENDGKNDRACSSDVELIQQAREDVLLQNEGEEGEDPVMATFHDDSAEVDRTSLGDLNGDGLADLVVFPGQNQGGAARTGVVYFSAGDCRFEFALTWDGDDPIPAPDGGKHHGVRDLIWPDHDSNNCYERRFEWDGSAYWENAAAAKTTPLEQC